MAPTFDGLDARYREVIGKEAARVQGGLDEPALVADPVGRAVTRWGTCGG
jgi:hypothetical protein